MKMVSINILEIQLDHIKFSLEMIQRSATHKISTEEEIKNLLKYVNSKIESLNDGAIDLNDIFKKGIA